MPGRIPKDNGDYDGGDPVRVWRADLDRTEEETAALRGLLAADERARADRFRFARDQRRFTVARGLLRRLIGGILDVAPDRVAFSYGTRGKPALKLPGDSGLEFNVSHSNGVALFATSWRRAVGIDLEYQREKFDFLGIADRYFTPEEVGQIQAQPPGEQRSAFFRGWARKEAFLKARGDGLWLGLDQFEVSIDPDLPPRVVRTVWDPEEAGRWTLLDLDVAGGFSAAMVVAGLVSGPIDVESL